MFGSHRRSCHNRRMCTLILAVGVWQDAPLVVAGNRDELMGRPAEGPKIRELDGCRFLAPADLEAGGTWIGVSASGMFVGVTNRFGAAPRGQKRRSRGLLVMDALVEDSVGAAVAKVMSEEPTRHNPFHLAVADRNEAHLVWNDGDENRHERLAPGFHVITERALGAAPTQRIALLHEALAPLFGPKVPEPDAWAEVLRRRGEPPLEGVCVYVPHRDYGTRSSSILMLSQDLEKSRYLHAEGPPDRVPYKDMSKTLVSLFG